MKLTLKDALNVLDTLKEWNEHPDLGPKELEELEVGLDHERYLELKDRLTFFIEREEQPTHR